MFSLLGGLITNFEGFVFFLVIDTLQKNSFRLKRTKTAHVGSLSVFTARLSGAVTAHVGGQIGVDGS